MAKKFNELPMAVQVAVPVLLATLLAAGIFWSKVLPLKEKGENLKKQADAVHADNVANQAVEREHAEYINRIAQLQKQLETLRTIVPDEQATDEFVRLVYETATAADVHVRTFVAQSLGPHDFYVEMPFTVRLDGTYFTLLNFFDRLAHAQRIVSVNSVGLSLGPPGGGGMGAYTVSPVETVGANCVLTTYFNKPQQTAAPTKK